MISTVITYLPYLLFEKTLMCIRENEKTHLKSLIRKDPDTEKDRRQKEKGMTEDEMVGWHH